MKKLNELIKQKIDTLNIVDFCADKYAEGYSVNSISRMLHEQNNWMTQERIKEMILSRGIELRAPKAQSKLYKKPGRYSHIK